MASPTPNKGYTYDAHGGGINAWDTPLNADFDRIDLNVGGVYLITASSTTVTSSFSANSAVVPSTATSITPNTSLAQNMFYRVAGAITSSMTILFPTVGSFYVIANETSSGTLKVNTAAGTSAVTVAIGGNNMVVTSTYASQSANIVGQFPAKLYTTLGAPAISATAGSAEGDLTTTAWDATNRQLYVCATSGTSATAVFAQTMARPTPQGYLTLSTDATNPILTADAAAKAAVYYTPFTGSWAVLSNGTTLYPAQFSQLALVLGAGVQTANNIYDVFMYNSTAGVLIGTGPAWTGAGAGTGTRGAGAGTTQLAKLQGVFTNAVQVTLTNGSTAFTCPINQGVYLGSLLMDATNGQVTCHRAYGQSRKWGVWNNYNAQPIAMNMGDGTASWTNGSSIIRYANGSTSNHVKAFAGMAANPITTSYINAASITFNSATEVYSIGIGWNSTSAFSGAVSRYQQTNNNTNNINIRNNSIARYVSAPSLGMQEISALEVSTDVSTWTVIGTEASMQVVVTYNA